MPEYYNLNAAIEAVSETPVIEQKQENATVEGEDVTGQPQVDAEAEVDDNGSAMDTPRPIGWTDEDWAAVPQEARAAVVSRENARQATLAQERQAALEDVGKRAALVEQAEQQAIAQAKRYADMIDNLIAQLQPTPPNQALIDENPQEFLRQQAAYEQARNAVDALTKNKGAVLAEVGQAEQALDQRWLQEETLKLQQRVPDFADPVRGPALSQSIGEYALKAGVPAEALRMASAVEVEILMKAMRWDQAEAARMQVKAKVAQAPRIAAPVKQRDSSNKAVALNAFVQAPTIENAIAALKG